MTHRALLRPLLLVLLLPAFVGCNSLARHRTIETATGEELETEALVERLAAYDVVFLGELHDDDTAHALQLDVTRGLFEHHGRLAISLEMFERDVQPELDAYLRGASDEATFLESSRPWKNYADHYRPVIELARAEGLDVLAANIPRPLARRVAYEGLSLVMGEPHMPIEVFLMDGDGYRTHFERAMGVKEGEQPEDPERLATWFAAQCVKDDAMAESIALHIANRAPDAPPVVHWCGRFHSDFRLGTVARLKARRPSLSIAVVTTVRRPDVRGELAPEDLRRGDYVWLVEE